jgi:hypothetical protein
MLLGRPFGCREVSLVSLVGHQGLLRRMIGHCRKAAIVDIRQRAARQPSTPLLQFSFGAK